MTSINTYESEALTESGTSRGVGVASHAGVGMLREVAENSGLSDEITVALADTYKGPWIHAPGRVFTNLACAIANGADAVTGIEHLGDREGFFGPVASMPTTWRGLEKIDPDHLARVRKARAAARERAWAAGAGPDLREDLVIDFDGSSEFDCAITASRQIELVEELADGSVRGSN